MEPSKKILNKIKATLEKQHGREFTSDEVSSVATLLSRLAELALDVAKEDHRRQQLLKGSPDGFHLDKPGYTCLICGWPASGKDSWFDKYDKYGLKCMTCQKAVNDKIIPGSVAKDKESWYTKFDLERYFNLKGAFLRRLIKQGTLKDRVIPGLTTKVHLQLFLIGDNKEVLPPKEILESRIITVTEGDQQYYTQEPWYFSNDPAEHLKGFKILDYLKETLAERFK